MKKIRIFSCMILLLSFTMSIIFIGCNSGNETNNVEKTTSTKKIRIFNSKTEIEEQLKNYAKQYKKKTGIEVEIESAGASASSITDKMQGYLASNNMPDIFAFSGKGVFDNWKEYMVDLSEEEWVDDTDYSFKDENGNVYGFPFSVEGYGLIYNKDLLDKAGIDPNNLTTIDELRSAFQKLEGMKDELGIESVISTATSVAQNMDWSTGYHQTGVYISAGLKRGDTTIIDQVNSGKVDNDRLEQWSEYVELLFKYSNKEVLLNGTYEDQIKLWAEGKSVFIHQGNWIDPMLEKYNINFNVGIAPHAFTHEKMDGIMVDAPSYWAIFNGSKNIEEAKDFLESVASTKEGEEFLKKCGLISPYKSSTESPETPVGKALNEWIKNGNITYDWQMTNLPEGFTTDKLGVIYEKLALSEIDRNGFASEFASEISKINSN